MCRYGLLSMYLLLFCYLLILLAYSMCKLILFLINFEVFLKLSSNSFFASIFFSSLETQLCVYWTSDIVSQDSIFVNSFFLHCSDWMIYITLSKFTISFLCHFYSTTELIQWIFEVHKSKKGISRSVSFNINKKCL
jgi:hypothetical protein